MLTTLASHGEGFDDFGAQFGDLGRPLETSGAALGSVVVFVSVVGGICMSMGWLWWQSWHLFNHFLGCLSFEMAAQNLDGLVDAFRQESGSEDTKFCC